jgi:hypothetical protein
MQGDWFKDGVVNIWAAAQDEAVGSIGGLPTSN